MVSGSNKQEKDKAAMEKATDTQVSAKPNWKGKRGKMLQEMGAALLAEPGTDEKKLARFLENTKE